jgi:cold shock CspA family protein
MEVPLELTFRDIEKTTELEDLIVTKASKLEEVCDHVTSCRVMIERAQESRRTGNPVQARVEVRVPHGKEIVVTREASREGATDPLPALIRQVFSVVRRQLREVVDQQRGEVKPHVSMDEAAIVAKLFSDRDYGFLETMDRREIFFHRNSVLNDDFDRLEIGTGVRFVEEEGEKGPQATSVRIVDKSGVNLASSGQ